MYNVIFVEIQDPGISELEFIRDIKHIDPLLQILVLVDKTENAV